MSSPITYSIQSNHVSNHVCNHVMGPGACVSSVLTRNITNNSKHKSKTMYGQWGMGPPLREHEVVPTLREVVGLARGIFAHGQDLGAWILDLGHGPDPRSWILAMAKIWDLGHDQDLASWPRPRSWIFATAKILDLGHGQDQTHTGHH